MYRPRMAGINECNLTVFRSWLPEKYWNETTNKQKSNILVTYEKNNSKNDNTNKMENNDTTNNDLFNKSIGTLFPVSEEKTRA